MLLLWGADFRSHKRYYYRNSVNGEAQWTYPESDVVGGTEEMDLCTTPPPPEDEESLIIGIISDRSSLHRNEDALLTLLLFYCRRGSTEGGRGETQGGKARRCYFGRQ